MPRTLSAAMRRLNCTVSPKPRNWSLSIWRVIQPRRRAPYLSRHPSPDGSLLGQGRAMRAFKHARARHESAHGEPTSLVYWTDFDNHAEMRVRDLTIALQTLTP